MKLLRQIRWIIDRSLIRDGYSGTLTLLHRLLACALIAISIAIIWVAVGVAGSIGLLF